MLETLWYSVVATAILFYVILDGFDLGVGALHLFAKTDEQRRTFLNAIGPVWDGNEVWIVIVIGGLFAGFPNVYATVLSGFYTLFMILIAGLMFRAVAIEFRSKRESKKWRSVWDVVFSAASIFVALVIGILFGNIIEGIPLNSAQDYIGDFSTFFRPYSILVSIVTLSLFTMHGCIYLAMKTEGKTNDLIQKWIYPSLVFFIFSYLILTVVTLQFKSHMTDRLYEFPILFIVPILAFFSIMNIFYQVRKKNDGWAFVSSCISISLLLSLFALGVYPNLVLSTVDPEMNTLTIFNSSSSPQTLKILLTIVGLGLPLVFAYGFWVYRIFKGKVKLDASSY